MLYVKISGIDENHCRLVFAHS